MTTAAAMPTQLQVRDLLMGFVVSRAIQVAAELGVADALAQGPLAPEALAEKTGTHPGALTRLLRLLECHGIFEQRDGSSYANTPMSEFLRDGTPGSLRGFATMFGDAPVWQAWQGLSHSVRTSEAAFSHIHGIPIFDYLARHPASAKRFDSAMAGSSSMLNGAIVEAYDWKQFGDLVDVGGGLGSTLAAILEANPGLRGILFDLPHVIERARAFTAEPSLANRCQTVNGSFFDFVPPDGDAYLLKHILHDWGDEECIAILRACRNAMPEHAKLLVCEKLIEPGKARSYANLMDMVMLALTQGGRERTPEEFESLFSAAGLRLARIVPTRADNVLIEGVKIA